MSLPEPTTKQNRVEKWFEGAIFMSRWLLAPIYLGLAASLAVLLVKFVQRTIDLVSHVITTDGNNAIVGILSLVDLSLMGNLILMVMFAGYENFVSRLDIDGHEDRPAWMGHVDFGDLKLKLMTSIVAISAIQLLERFMNVDHSSDRDLAWSTGIHMAFILSAILLALMDRIVGKAHPPSSGGDPL